MAITRGPLDFDPYSRLEATPIKTLEHYGQNFLEHRYQEFSENWGIRRNHITDLIPLEEIAQVPIKMIFGSEDEFTSFNFQRDQLDKLNKDLLTGVWLEGYDHWDFGKGNGNEDLELVLSALDNTLVSDTNFALYTSMTVAEATIIEP